MLFRNIFKKFVPQSISVIVIPFLALIPTVLISNVVLGPIGWEIGTFISDVIYNGLTSKFGFIFAAYFWFLICSIGYNRIASYDKCNRFTTYR